MMNVVKDVQQKLQEANEQLANSTITGESGGGLVKVTMNGKKELSKIELDPSIETDIEMVKDLIIAAVNTANNKVDTLKADLIKDNTSGSLPNIPGLDLGKLFNG